MDEKWCVRYIKHLCHGQDEDEVRIFANGFLCGPNFVLVSSDMVSIKLEGGEGERKLV